MKARIEIPKMYRKQIDDQCNDYVNKKLNEERLKLISRTIKIMSVVLHESFGFGGVRLYRAWQEVVNRTNDMRDDPVAWQHTDKLLLSMGLPIEKENYEELGE